MSAILYMDLGIKLFHDGEWEDAALAFAKAITLNPNYAKAYNNLGLALKNTGKLSEAKACFTKAIELNPDDACAFNNLGLIFADCNDRPAAEGCFRRAIEINPDMPDVYNNLGLLLEENQRFAEAEFCFREAIVLKADYAEACYHLGTLLRAVKQLAEAEKYLKLALEIRPGFKEPASSLSLLYLLRGEMEKGWPLYEKIRPKRYSNLPYPYWQGEDLAQASILLFWEYGYGDTMQFVRYIDKVLEVTQNITLFVQRPLERLLKEAYPELTVYSGDNLPDDVTEGSFDFACSFLSLPGLFYTTNGTIPLPRAYAIPSEVIEKWRQTLEGADGGNHYRVGVAWAAHTKHENTEKRSIPLYTFAELFLDSKVTWVSLQVDERSQDLEKAKCPVINFSTELLDYLETAALVANLDLVITVDTSVAHLAGTMGKKTWVLTTYDPDWRWQLEREDSPWYKSVRLFRQQNIGDWAEVIERVKSALQEEFS